MTGLLNYSFLRFFHGILALILLMGITSSDARAACPGCDDYAAGSLWGVTTSSSLIEASGLAVSARNPGVVWAHNDDGNDGHLYAFGFNGAFLGSYDFNVNLSDVEDMALGRGPVAGQNYLYVADIGGAGSGNGLRGSVQILRMPEPNVSLAQDNSPDRNLSGVQRFTLSYPEPNADFDAEVMMLDPITGDLFIGTKQNSGARIYRVNLNGAANNAELDLEFVRMVSFADASGGAISADGRQIIIRREDTAQIWMRCDGESVGDALARAGTTIPVMGPPAEPNGEAVAFLPDGSGYLTVSDSQLNPPFYFFQKICDSAEPPPGEISSPTIVTQPQSQVVASGTTVQLTVAAEGTAPLAYQWFYGRKRLTADGPVLNLPEVQAKNSGKYRVVVSNGAGSTASAYATLRVLAPPVIVRQPVGSARTIGSRLTLRVVSKGSPRLAYQWLFNDIPIPGATRRNIALRNLQPTDSGSYSVMVSNAVGTVTSVPVILSIP